MKRYNVKGNKIYKFSAVVIATVIAFGLGWVISMPSTDDAETKELYAMIESDASLEVKMIYLEKRVTGELTTLNMIVSYSDLCSNKYLNELDSLSLNMTATLDAYEVIEDELKGSEIIISKYDNYRELIKKYEKMVESIHETEYDDALELLQEVNSLREASFIGIDNEIAKLGSK